MVRTRLRSGVKPDNSNRRHHVSRNPHLLRSSLAVAGVAAAVGALAGGAGAKSTATAPVLKLESVSVTANGKTSRHSVLVNGAGHAVYLLTGDSAKHPECESSSCLGYWPAVTSSAKRPLVGKGVTGKVAIWRHGGISQVTINGHPLYTYLADSSAGEATGEGLASFGGTWEVLSASGVAASFKSPSSSSYSSGSGW
jgi:predicted lipoprotein with Yx(FWY)xxD motif